MVFIPLVIMFSKLKALVEKAGIPAAWTILGLSAMDSDHPLNVGMVGMHGNYGPNVLTNECDVLIAIGMRFDDRVTGNLESYAKQAKIIHFEIDPAEVNKNVPVDVAVLGDARETLSDRLRAHRSGSRREGETGRFRPGRQSQRPGANGHRRPPSSVDGSVSSELFDYAAYKPPFVWIRLFQWVV